MAVLSGSQVDVVHDEGSGGMRAMLLRLQKVNTNDTVDVGAYFSKVTAAAFVGLSAQSNVFSLPIAGTVLTINPGALVNDIVYVLVIGVSAP